MARHDPEETPRMTEPDTIPATFASVADVEKGDHVVRIVAMDDFMLVGYDGPERRIVARLVMPVDAARRLLRDLRAELQRGGH